MDKTKVYYLSHPCTSFGDKKVNIANSLEIQKHLMEKGHIVINPISLIDTDDEKFAMKKCREIYEKCTDIILCLGWDQSTGCKIEYRWAIEDGKPIHIYSKEGLLISFLTLEHYRHICDMQL